MSQFYFILWAVIAVYLLVVAKRTGALCYALSAFFAFMAVWYALNSFSGIAMFEGTLGIVFKCIVGAFLLALVAVYIVGKIRKKNSSDGDDGNNKK